MNNKIPIMILTGFLGAGKTTLLNRILSEKAGKGIAVIENEFSKAGIDNELLCQEKDHIVEMSNGAICCSVRSDLIRSLNNLSTKRQKGQLAFDRIIIETTGLADPGPVAQVFLTDSKIAEQFSLDAIITIVDAKHAMNQLAEHRESQVQVGFADFLLISKSDLITPENLNILKNQLRSINARAPIELVNFGNTDIKKILNLKSFNLDNLLDVAPNILNNTDHTHNANISSFVYQTELPFDGQRIIAVFNNIINTYGKDLLRYKGILNIATYNNKRIYQGVHFTFIDSIGKAWQKDEYRQSIIVFIGTNLDKERIKRLIDLCITY